MACRSLIRCRNRLKGTLTDKVSDAHSHSHLHIVRPKTMPDLLTDLSGGVKSQTAIKISRDCLCQTGFNKKNDSWDHVTIKEYAFRICREFLQGVWRTVPITDFQCSEISGGLSNLLYLCELTPNVVSDVASDSREPRRVLLRIHCQIHDALMKENIIFTVLSERRIGPRLHGVFTGGRIEEFVQASPLKTEELSDGVVSKEIARQMAKLHMTDIPICKEPKWVGDVLSRWWQITSATRPDDIHCKESVQLFKDLVAFPFSNEIEYVKSLLHRMRHSPVTFCHNDIQEGNILKVKSEPCDLMLIDFEYCSYNYSTFDIANHFCEWTINYKVDEAPFFALTSTHFPTTNQQRTFIRAYLEELRTCDGEVDMSSEEERILAEVPSFVAISHLLWSLWSLVQAKISPISFGYVEYAEYRLNCYKEVKKSLSS